MKIEEYEAAAEAILFAMGDSVELKKLAFALQVGELGRPEFHHLWANSGQPGEADRDGRELCDLGGAA